jgi:hypothetical protein
MSSATRRALALARPARSFSPALTCPTGSRAFARPARLRVPPRPCLALAQKTPDARRIQVSNNPLIAPIATAPVGLVHCCPHLSRVDAKIPENISALRPSPNSDAKCNTRPSLAPATPRAAWRSPPPSPTPVSHPRAFKNDARVAFAAVVDRWRELKFMAASTGRPCPPQLGASSFFLLGSNRYETVGL